MATGLKEGAIGATTCALTQHVEVADTEVRLKGSKSELLRTLVTASSEDSAEFGVHSSVLKWRARQEDDFPCCKWVSGKWGAQIPQCFQMQRIRAQQIQSEINSQRDADKRNDSDCSVTVTAVFWADLARLAYLRGPTARSYAGRAFSRMRSAHSWGSSRLNVRQDQVDNRLVGGEAFIHHG